MKKWNELPYLAKDDVIFTVLEPWPPEWCAPANSVVKSKKSAAQRKNEEEKLWMAQLVEKRRNKAVASKVQEARDTTKAREEQQRAAKKDREGAKSPSPAQETDLEEGGADPQTTSTQLKRQCLREQVGQQKKSKASKTSFDLITLTEGDLHDIGETVRDITTEALQQFVEENTMLLGALWTQIQELQVCTPQAGILSTSLAVGTNAAEEILRACTTNTIVLPEGAFVIENEADRPTVSALKGVGINMVVIPREMLYVLHDGGTIELCAKEGRTLQVMSEKRINMEQLSLQHNEVVTQNSQLVKVVEEACQIVPKMRPTGLWSVC